jgi:hypothetical protein
MAASVNNKVFTLGGTAEAALAADASRRSVMIHVNGDSDMWFNFLGTAAADQGFLLLGKTNNGGFTGERRVMYAYNWPEIRNALSAFCADTNAKYTVQASVKI